MPTFTVKTPDLVLLNPFNGTIGASANVNADIGIKNPLPKITVGIDPLTVNPLSVDIGVTALPPIKIGIDPITINPLSIGITDLPVIRIDVLHLPLIDLQFGFRPQRFHFPVNLKLAICVLGKELLSVGTCGESMVVVEDYVAHETERCS